MRKDRGLGNCLNQTIFVESTVFLEQNSTVCCDALELCQLLQAQGFFRQKGYDIECRISVSFMLASIKSICKDQIGGFNEEDICCLLSSPKLPPMRDSGEEQALTLISAEIAPLLLFALSLSPLKGSKLLCEVFSSAFCHRLLEWGGCSTRAYLFLCGGAFFFSVQSCTCAPSSPLLPLATEDEAVCRATCNHQYG